MRRAGIALLLVLAVSPGVSAQAPPEAGRQAAVGKPPQTLKLDLFYEKYLDAGGIPVISSGKVPDEALVVAAGYVEHMLAKRPDLLKALGDGGVRVAVMGKGEVTTDLPEHRKLRPKDYWDRRARGLGGTRSNPTTSCAEENVLGYADDRYNGESILIHEFAHTVHEVGLRALDREFDARLRAQYERAIRDGLWAKTYSATNHKEYWAEGVQSYFDCNRRVEAPDGVHNHVRTREQLREYDPGLADLVDAAFDRNPWRWSPNGAHARRWRKD